MYHYLSVNSRLRSATWKLAIDMLARHIFLSKISWRRLEGVLKTSWRYLEDVLTRPVYLQSYFLKASWRHLCKMSWRRLYDFKMSSTRVTRATIFVLIKASLKRFEDVFLKQRRKTSLAERLLAGTYLSECSLSFR